MYALYKFSINSTVYILSRWGGWWPGTRRWRLGAIATATTTLLIVLSPTASVSSSSPDKTRTNQQTLSFLRFCRIYPNLALSQEIQTGTQIPVCPAVNVSTSSINLLDQEFVIAYFSEESSVIFNKLLVIYGRPCLQDRAGPPANCPLFRIVPRKSRFLNELGADETVLRKKVESYKT